MRKTARRRPASGSGKRGRLLLQTIIPNGLVILSIILGWFVALRYQTVLEEAVISSWQQTQLEVVRAVARSVSKYVDDYFTVGTSLSQIEQEILKQQVMPVKLLQSGDAWIYAPDHVIFDLSSDFPDAYRNKSMTQIFQIQKNYGASHYEDMCEDVANAREGVGWYIWLPDKGPEIAAWSPVQFQNYTWTIGLSTPLNEILVATGAASQHRAIFMVMGFTSILGLVFVITFTISTMRQRRQDLALEENHLRLQQVVEDMKVEVDRRIRTESRLIEMNARFNALFQAIPDSVYLKDLSGKYLVVNASFERLVGRKGSDILGYEDDTGLLPEWIRPNPQIEEKVGRDGKLHRFEKTVVSEDGHEWYLEMVVSPVMDDMDQVTGLVGMIRDVTDIRLAELEHRRLSDQLAQLQKMEAIGSLAGGVAHDLNNILAGIVSYPELLILNLPPDSPLKQPLETIQRSGQMAADIVQDLLALARRGVREKSVINLNRIIKEYVSSPIHTKLTLERPEVTIRLDLADNLLFIAGTESDLSKTVMNLVINAYEAIHGEGSVTLSTENWYVDGRQTAFTDIHEGEYIRLCVSDSGEGISPEIQSRIFEPFFSKKALHRSGSGLGLAVVWGTLQDHGGHIDVLSSSEKGTRFELYFPACRDVAADNLPKTPLAELSGTGRSVLVIDDVSMQREIATAMLTKLGYQVFAVASGEAAIDFVKQNPVDLLLLDMIMEGLDGLDTYRQILALYPNQKAIIASGFSESKRLTEALGLGSTTYLKKPYLIESLARSARVVMQSEASNDLN